MRHIFTQEMHSRIYSYCCQLFNDKILQRHCFKTTAAAGLLVLGRLCSSFSKLSFVFLSKEILHHFPVSFKPFSLSDVVKNKESGLGLVGCPVRFLKVGGERLYKLIDWDSKVELGHPPIWCVPVQCPFLSQSCCKWTTVNCCHDDVGMDDGFKK